MNVLINAYAVSPTCGSEPGMGWNWISCISKYCNLFIITEGEWQKEIEKAVQLHPYKSHLHFYYLPIPGRVRKMCWNQGDWRFYGYYRKWQKRALIKAREICKTEGIDIIHQLNMVGFREPGYLWKIGKPMIWGPVGGLVDIKKPFLKDAPLMTRMMLSVKKDISLLQIRYSRRVNQAVCHSHELISAVPIMQQILQIVKRRESKVIAETGCYDIKAEIKDKRNRAGIKILWVGRFIYTKRLDIALRTIASLKDLSDLHFYICGSGSKKSVYYYKNLAQQLDIAENCHWYGNVENKIVHEIMQDADLFFFTSISEATSTVVPEAINNSLPIVCFNACGFGPLVTKEIGRTVELTTPEQAVNEFSEIIRDLYYDKEELYKMSSNCKQALKGLLWEEKAKNVIDMYERCLQLNR